MDLLTFITYKNRYDAKVNGVYTDNEYIIGNDILKNLPCGLYEPSKYFMINFESYVTSYTKLIDDYMPLYKLFSPDVLRYRYNLGNYIDFETEIGSVNLGPINEGLSFVSNGFIYREKPEVSMKEEERDGQIVLRWLLCNIVHNLINTSI
jgi:hypothetical protein